MSSSDATTSWVATSGFHCSAEQRLRLREALDRAAGCPSAPPPALAIRGGMHAPAWRWARHSRHPHMLHAHGRHLQAALRKGLVRHQALHWALTRRGP